MAKPQVGTLPLAPFRGNYLLSAGLLAVVAAAGFFAGGWYWQAKAARQQNADGTFAAEAGAVEDQFALVRRNSTRMSVGETPDEALAASAAAALRPIAARGAAAGRDRRTTFWRNEEDHSGGRLRLNNTHDLAPLPADFETSAALLINCADFPEYFREAFFDLLRELDGRIPLVALVEDEEVYLRIDDEMAMRDLPATKLDFIEVPSNTVWIRDFGPRFARLHNGMGVVLDTEYMTNGANTRPLDDQVPERIAHRLGLPRVSVPLSIDGGNLLSNGDGIIVTSTTVLDENYDRAYDPAMVGKLIQYYFGATTWVVLKPLEGERTGHVDMFLTFLAPNVAVLGEMDPQIDPENADLLDRHAARLSTIQTSLGPMQVHRIPMPPPQDQQWRTYTNVLFANDLLVVPTYESVDPELEKRALDVYRRLLPDWQIVTISAEKIIERGGSLHCISLNVPVFNETDPRDGLKLRRHQWEEGDLDLSR